MGSIQADVDGLSVLAANCEQRADVVSTVVGPPPVGPSFQASAAAVLAAHDDITAAGNEFMARMQSTAADVTIAAHEYALTEAGSASAVSAIATKV
ncbi:hypothetical protein [Mycobacterium sp.]|uniref:hypothetical protein n=1 Tax=Mycobacterium sp. TaxID=1785 RepID=UPI002F14C748